MAGRRMLASIAVVFILLIATSAASSHAYPPLRRMTRQTVPDDGSSNTPADNPGTSPVNSPIDRTGAPSQNGNLPPGPSGGGAANSIIGLSLEEPTCLTRDADTPLQTDCIIAMNAMEMEWGSRITAYIGTSASLRILQGLPAMPQIDFLGLPRVYWAGSCVISVGSNTERQEATGNPVKGDWAHKNALMVSTAFVIDKCVRTHKGGGWVTAGFNGLLSITVVPLRPPSSTFAQSNNLLLVLDRLHRDGNYGAKFSYAGGNFHDSRITDVTPINKPSSPAQSGNAGNSADSSVDAMSSLSLPPTSCQVSKASCGYGVDCRAESPSRDGIGKLLWGALLEVSSCAWSSVISPQGLRI